MRVERDERGAWTAWFDRPAKRNALDEATRRQLADVVAELSERPDVRALVLRGEGPSFCAGADLADRPAAAPTSTPRHATGAWQRLLDDWEALPQVTVAVLHGHVVGGGALLAVACDLRLAADDVAVAIPEVALGLPLTWGGVPRLAREVGLPVARDLVLTGRRLDAADALRTGFVQRVVPAGELDAACDELVAGLLAQPPDALAVAKASLAAMTRTAPGMAGTWADADLLLAALRGDRPSTGS